LRRLSNQRSQAAKDFLTNANQVAPERIFIVTPQLDAQAPKDKAKPSRVDFSLKR
jgi:hypothetical protein